MMRADEQPECLDAPRRERAGEQPPDPCILGGGVRGARNRWNLRMAFRGHHISLDLTIVDGEVIGATPLFFGADPAVSPQLAPPPPPPPPPLHRPLAGAEDYGCELVRSLTVEQPMAAVISPSSGPTALSCATATARSYCPPCGRVGWRIGCTSG